MARLFSDYISDNYVTIMTLFALAMQMLVNCSKPVKGVKLMLAVMALVMVLSVFDFIEIWCDSYNKPVWILYFKASVVYTIYPLLILIETYMTVPIKRKLLLAVPQIVNIILLSVNLFGVNIIYGYRNDHSFFGGPLRFYPVALMIFYIIILTAHAIEIINEGDKQRGLIILFISLASIITIFLELIELISHNTDEVCALGLLIYYWYMTAIYHNKIQAMLYKSKLDLEHSKNDLLIAQIQPHFINNSLMALRSQCRDNPDLYESITEFSKYLRSHFEALSNTKMISFEQEMSNVEAYLSLERLNFGERLQVEYDIELDNFLVPALSVQPLVENAVRHGIGTYEEGGTVKISVHKNNGFIIIEIIDDGSGKSSLTVQQKKRKGIGIDNVRSRLRSMQNAELDIIMTENGTTARITLSEEAGR